MKALVVDDDMATVEMIRESVPWEKLDISKVETAYNIRQAKAVLEQEDMDIVISDIEMPQGSGLELLEWMRENGKDSEFLLLTCHEEFSYASRALRLDAAEYLTKPFNPAVMEHVLLKIIHKAREKQAIKKSSRTGAWITGNEKKNFLTFWNELLGGYIQQDKEKIRQEILGRQLKINPEGSFRIILSRAVNFEQAEEQMGRGLLEFFLLGLCAEVLLGEIENKHTVCYADGKSLMLLTVSAAAGRNRNVLEGRRRAGDKAEEKGSAAAEEIQEEAELRERCRELIARCEEYVHIPVTCCISGPIPLEGFAETRDRLGRCISENVAYYRNVFSEAEAVERVIESDTVLDLKNLGKWLQDHDRRMILGCLKEVLSEKERNKTLSEHVLFLMKQELLQMDYAYLMQSGIQATKLFHDETSARLLERSTQSSVDMIRWANYLLERTFSYEEEVKKSSTIIGKIEEYIREHYAEDISRTEIAKAFYLTPEYLAKLYKKKTGNSIKNAILEERIKKAKTLLKKEEIRISDVAGMVGFDNFSYFSTLFKKYTGMTPKEYKGS